MLINKKISITLIIFAVLAVLLIFIIIIPLFRQIAEESRSLIMQKNKVAEAEAKIENIHDFMANFRQYQPDLEKIDQLFADIYEPVEFIEFLESGAAAFQLSIEIAPPILKKQEWDNWQAFEFSLNLKGSFPNFLKFLDTLEATPYLIWPINLSITKLADTKNAVSISLLIMVYAKWFSLNL